MRLSFRVAVFAGIAASAILAMCGVALADGGSVTERGILRPLAWANPGMATTRVYATTNVAGAWAIVDVLDARGVRRTLFDGPAGAAGVRFWTLPWNGTDSAGHRLPTGNYQYRVRILKGTRRYTATGVMPVSKWRFVVSSEGDASFSRYMYPGMTWVYAACTYTGDAFLDAFVARATTREWTMPGQDLSFAGPGDATWRSPSTAAFRYVSSGEVGRFRNITLNATDLLRDPSAPPWPPIAGTFSLTFVQ